ncbi:LamG-like jellyroll fold domain-containing protein [Saccharothrix sp. NPDC042600]|uniref:LamG-like jellyroll fold domain-containing protein n=1 Tax=Saccharothrix TaxID=2071 RepID=UPI0033EC78FD
MFVAPNGDDANPGTQAAPLRTATAAVGKAVAGRMTTVVFREGEYRERLGDISAPVTLQPFPNERVWFKGSTELPSDRLVVDGNAWRLDGWNPGSVCRATAPDYDECMNPLHFNNDHPVGGDPQMVFLDGEPLRQVATREEVRAGTFFHDGPADKTYLGSDPAGRRFEITARKSGLHFFAGAEGSVVRGLGFAHYGSSQNQTREPAAIVVQAKGMVVENNTVIHNAAAGVLVNADDVRLTGNSIAENGYHGLTAHRSGNLTFEGNRVLRNNSEQLGFNLGYNLAAAGAHVTRLTNPTVRDNVFEANQGHGFACDLSCVGLTAVRNLFRANSHHGLHYKVSGPALVASNVAADNGMGGLSLMGSNSVRLYNNTSVGNGQALVVQEDPRPQCPGAEDQCLTDADKALGITWNTTDTTLVNNIFAAGTSTASLVSTPDHNAAASGQRLGADGMIPADRMHHNGYQRSGGTPATLVQWSRVTGVSLHFRTLAEFQAATGRDAGSRHQEDPYLLGAPAGDYRLAPGSPAEAAGAPLPADVAAAIGAPTGSTRLGAHAWPTAPTKADLVRNGTFDTPSTLPWFSAGNPRLAVEQGMLKATVAEGAANPGDAVVVQRTGTLVSGRIYTLSFDAAASTDVAVQVAVQEGDTPYSASLTQDIELTPTPARFSFPFTATMDTTVAEVVFQLGGKGALSAFVDNVSLVENTWGVAKEPKADEAQALAAAAATGQLVEVLSERGEAREVYATPDGSFTSQEHFQPVRAAKDGGWAPVDTTLRKRADGAIAPVTTPVAITLSGGGTGPFTTIDRAGRPMSLTWPTALPAPRLEGDTAVYPNVLPEVDLRVQVEPEGFSHILVVKTAQAAKDPRLTTLTLGLSAPGLTVGTAEDGTQQAVDQATGAVVYEAPVPIMWDSTTPTTGALTAQTDEDAGDDAFTLPSAEQPGDTSKVAQVTTSVTGGEMTLRPDAELLNAADTAYPVYIDPMWDTPRASARLMVSSGGWSKHNFKKDEGMGRCPRDYPPAGRYCGGWYEKRLFYRVPTARFAHKQIISAEFHVRGVWSTSCKKRIVDIHLASAFKAGSTWSSTSDNWKRRLDSRNVAKGFGSGCAAGDVLFNVTSGLRETAKAGAASTTFGLRARDGDDQLAWKRFGRDAYVRVHYNTPPAQPKMGQLSSSPGGACRGPDSPARFNRLPALFARNLTDPDNKGVEGEKLKAQFQLSWTDAGGARRTKNLGTVSKMSSHQGRGSSFSVKVPANVVPQGVTVAWEVRAYDGRAWSPWSSAGNATACYFVYDARALPEPKVTSTDYPALDPANPNQVPADGVGRYGRFSIAFDARVAKYAFAVNTDPSEGSAKAKSAATEAVDVMPTQAGLNVLHVTAWDASNNWSTGTYEFWVAEGRAPKAHWALDEQAGATRLADTAPKSAGQASHPATPQGGATLGVGGALGTAMNLNGTTSYAATSGAVVDTAKNIAVSAWVKLPATLPTTHVVVASQSGAQMSGFYLKFDPNDKKWRFWRTQGDGNTTGGGTAISRDPAQPGVWTHLVGVQDVVAKKLRLYVNGVEQVAADIVGTPWNAGGALQIGRGIWKGAYTDHTPGPVDDVRVFDRVVTAEEVKDLFTIKPVVQSKWHLNTASGTSTPDSGQGPRRALTLAGNARITTDPAKVLVRSPAGTPSGALELPGGNTDFASVTGAVVDTRESFTVSAWVSTAGTPTRSMAVLSLAGAHNSAITVRYDHVKQRYVLDVPSKDATGATTVGVEHSMFHQGNFGDWDHIAVTFDGFEGTITLWVNGVREAAADADNLSFRHRTRPFGPVASLQLGRGLVGGAYPAGRNWSGLVDDVWVLRGVAAQPLVDALALPTEIGSIPS